MLDDSVASRVGLILGQTDFAHCLGPYRSFQTVRHMTKQLRAAARPDKDTDPVLVRLRKMAAERIVQSLPRGQQPEQLRRIGRFQLVGRYAVSQRLEQHFVHERASFAVGPVLTFGVWVEIVGDEPVCLGHLPNLVAPGYDVSPETRRIRRAGQQRSRTDDRDRGHDMSCFHWLYSQSEVIHGTMPAVAVAGSRTPPQGVARRARAVVVPGTARPRPPGD